MKQPLLLITRPAEENAGLVLAAQAAGFQTLEAPLMRIEALAPSLPDGRFDALLFTSPQGPRHTLHLKSRYGALPAYAVGAATGRAAEECGFQLVAIGDRDGSRIVAKAAMDGRSALLHACGEDAAAIEIPSGVRLSRVAVYRALLADALPEHARLALSGGEVFATLLYSARTAERFAMLAGKAGLRIADLIPVCLSHAVAHAAGPGWRAVGVADRPTTAALLAAARTLWQSRRDG